MSTDDLKAHAASNQDFYALLDVQASATETEIRRAYRRTALKYHPDKIANPTAADIDKFHFLQIAYDVLSDPDVKQLYDNAREARLRKQREREMMGAAKRKMREDLEARERAGATEGATQGVKRSWMGDDDAEEKLQREIERIAEDGRRRRREADEKRKKEVDDAQKKVQEEEEQARKAADRSSQRVDRTKDAAVPELERAVKVRWVREGRGLELDIERLAVLFEPFGKVENTFMLKDKRQRVGEKKEKKSRKAMRGRTGGFRPTEIPTFWGFDFRSKYSRLIYCWILFTAVILYCSSSFFASYDKQWRRQLLISPRWTISFWP